MEIPNFPIKMHKKPLCKIKNRIKSIYITVVTKSISFDVKGIVFNQGYQENEGFCPTLSIK